MNKDMQFLRVVEIAAIASKNNSYKHLSKNDLDATAVKNMRHLINEIEGQSVIKVGEGDLDEAPMLYIGETLGRTNSKLKFDIAVDPIEGTINGFLNKGPSASVLCFAKKNTICNLPDMYMEKLFVHHQFVNLNLSLNKNILEIVKIMQTIKPNLHCIILDKPRHKELIIDLKNIGVEVTLINEGDVIGAVAVAFSYADFLYGIGGAPEGVIMAALAIASGAKFQGKLVRYDSIWKEKDKFQALELKKMNNFKLKYDQIFLDNDLISDSKVRFCLSFLTDWGFFHGVAKADNIYHVESVFASHGIVRIIKSKYNIEMLQKLKPKLKFLSDI